MWSSEYSYYDHDDFHVQHKVPSGDSPYVRAKHAQLLEKDPEKAILLFWAAINAGDRVDSALKDMAIVMKQQNRPEEAIQAIISIRHRCSVQAQEALDNVLLDLYKRCGKLDEQIALLTHKLSLIHQGFVFNGKRTKTARSQGRKFQVSIQQETSRLLGNLGWAFMQKNNYVAAEAVYRKALSLQPDVNKLCNLGVCLVRQGKFSEGKETLRKVTPDRCTDSHLKSFERAQEMLGELESTSSSTRHHSTFTKPSSSSSTGFPEHTLLKMPLTSECTNRQVFEQCSIWDEGLWSSSNKNFPARMWSSFMMVESLESSPSEQEEGQDNIAKWEFTHDPEALIEFCHTDVEAEEQQHLGKQRRLKVFEQITAAGSLCC